MLINSVMDTGRCMCIRQSLIFREDCIKMNVKEFPKVTLGIISIFVLLFVLDKTIFKGDLSKLGCSQGFNVIDKTEWYRFFTGSFFHVGILHLMANVFGIYFVGIILENKIGSFNFLLIYLLSNVAQSIVWAKVFPSTGFSCGASPGIYALIGCLLILYLNNINLIRPYFNTWALNYIVWYFFLANIVGLGGLIAHSLGLSFGLTISMILFIKGSLL